jgi:hypothetical protein
VGTNVIFASAPDARVEPNRNGPIMTIVATTHWIEHIPPGEDARHREYAEEMRALVEERATKSGRSGRAVHFKQHVGVTAKLIVGELPEELRVGPFAEPTIWPAYVRFSSSSPMQMHDRLPDVRGLALKLVGVPGAKLLPGLEQALTQDFVFVHIPVIPFETPDDLMAAFRVIRAGPILLGARLLAALGPRGVVRMLRGLVTMPYVTSLATTRFFTAAPLRFGDRAVKLDLVPEAASPKSLGKGRNALRRDLAARLDHGPIRYILRAQFFVDETITPIEDASVIWPTPYHELARLEIPAQDVTSARGQAIDEYVEALSFNPWHSLPELRPLGAMMRARVHAYRESKLERGALPEPDGSETF